MDQVFVEGLEFTGRHGVTARERRVGVRCSADVVVELDTRASAAADSLRQTVDYARIADIVVTLGTEESFKLLETLAERVAERILEETAAARVDVTVRKLRIGLPGNPQSCGVRISRSRRS